MPTHSGGNEREPSAFLEEWSERPQAGMHATTDYAVPLDAEHYRKGRTCPICGTPVSNRAQYCGRHATILREGYKSGWLGRFVERAGITR